MQTVDDYIKANLVHSIHTSERRSFRGCRRRHNWIFRDGYYPVVTVKPLEFGVAFHKAMEKLYDPLTWHDKDLAYQLARSIFVQTCEEQFKAYKKAVDAGKVYGFVDMEAAKVDYAERKDLGLGMLYHYAKHEMPKHDTNFEPVKVEIEFEVAIVDPNGEQLWCKCNRCRSRWNSYWHNQLKEPYESIEFGGTYVDADDPVDMGIWKGLPVTYGGRIDCLVKDNIGRYWIVDWKTAARLSTGEPGSDDDYLWLDDQITSYCTPLSTEIMTRRGWKTHSQLTIGDEVLGYNGEKDCLEWTKLEAVRYMGKQPVVNFTNKSFKFTTTPDHKWALRHPVWSTYKNKYELAPIRPGQQQTFAVLASTLDSPVLDITEDEAATIAWILSDGTFGIYNSGLRASICQSVTKYSNEIQMLLDRQSNAYSRIETRKPSSYGKSDSLVWHLRMDFFRTLWQRAGLDFQLNGWEAFATGMSSKARQAFNRAAHLAEGSANKGFTQNLGRKQDLFRLCIFLDGSFPTKRNKSDMQFTAGTPHKWLRTIRIEDNNEEVEVWCPQTSLGTWVMRQGSQIAITGNCWALWSINFPIAGFIYAELKKALAVEPEPLSRPYKGRIYSTNKQTVTTTYELFKSTVEENDPAAYSAGLYDDYLEFLQGRGQFHLRHQIHRNEAELRNAGINIWREAKDITSPDLLIYPSPGRFSCTTCAFKDPCLMMNRDEDYLYTLETLFEKRERHYYEREASTDSKGGQ